MKSPPASPKIITITKTIVDSDAEPMQWTTMKKSLKLDPKILLDSIDGEESKLPSKIFPDPKNEEIDREFPY